jgi:hypothetical protein
VLTEDYKITGTFIILNIYLRTKLLDLNLTLFTQFTKVSVARSISCTIIPCYAESHGCLLHNLLKHQHKMFMLNRDNISVKQVKVLNPNYANFEYIVRISRIKTLGGAVKSI